MRDMFGFSIFIAAILASLAASAFFSGTETGLLSVSRERILHLARKGGRRAQMVKRALADMDRTTATLLVGNNIANVAYSTTSTAAILALVSDSPVRSAASFAAAVIVLYFGEFLPKLLFSARPLRRILLIAPLYQAVAALLAPLAKLSLVPSAQAPSPRGLSPPSLKGLSPVRNNLFWAPDWSHHRSHFLQMAK